MSELILFLFEYSLNLDLVEIKKCKKQKNLGKPVKQKTRKLHVDWRACTTLQSKHLSGSKVLKKMQPRPHLSNALPTALFRPLHPSLRARFCIPSFKKSGQKCWIWPHNWSCANISWLAYKVFQRWYKLYFLVEHTLGT